MVDKSNLDLSKYLPLFRDANIDVSTSSVRPMQGGANNSIYFIDGHQKAVLKIYHQDHLDARDRFGHEINFIKLLEQDIHCLPKLLAFRSDLSASVLEWIDGEVVVNPDRADIVQVANFIVNINQQKILDKSRHIKLASDAFFTSNDHWNHVLKRFNLLNKFADQLGHLDRVQQVMDNLTNEIAMLNNSLILRTSDYRISSDQLILSPSDFGFHNILRKTNKDLIFIDFEYAGWDDPAKMYVDFCLQPRIRIHKEFQLLFFQILESCLPSKFFGISERCNILNKILSLKWVCISLNILSPEILKRKANIQNLPESTVLQNQLLVAEKFLEEIKNEKY